MAPTTSGAAASSTPSSRRCGAASRIQGQPRVTPITMIGTSISSVRVLAKNRVRQTSQYGSPLKSVTTAASANDDRNGAPITA